MFSHIGKKIKGLAVAAFVIGIVFSVCIAFSLTKLYAEDNGVLAVIIYSGTVVMGILFSWLSVLILYGFGELVDQSMETNQRLEENHAVLEEILSSIKEQDCSSETMSRSAAPRKRSYEREQKANNNYGDIDAIKLPLRNEQGTTFEKTEETVSEDTLYIPEE